MEGVPVKLVQCSVKHMVQKQLRNEAFFFRVALTFKRELRGCGT